MDPSDAPIEEPETPAPSQNVAAEAQSEAIDTLTDLADWSMSSARWARIEQLLESISEAHSANDIDALRQLVWDLELAGPTRITRIGSSDTTGPPARVRNRADRLIHQIGMETTGAETSTPGPAEHDCDEGRNANPDQ